MTLSEIDSRIKEGTNVIDGFVKHDTGDNELLTNRINILVGIMQMYATLRISVVEAEIR